MDKQPEKRALKYQTALSQHETLASRNSALKAKNDLLGIKMASLDKKLSSDVVRVPETMRTYW